MAKIGRPKAEEPKTASMFIRLLPQDKAAIEAYAREHKISQAETVMKGFNLLVQEK